MEQIFGGLIFLIAGAGIVWIVVEKIRTHLADPVVTREIIKDKHTESRRNSNDFVDTYYYIQFESKESGERRTLLVNKKFFLDYAVGDEVDLTMKRTTVHNVTRV